MEENNKINEIKKNTVGFAKKHEKAITISVCVTGGILLGVAIAKFGPKVVGYFTAGAPEVIETVAEAAVEAV